MKRLNEVPFNSEYDATIPVLLARSQPKLYRCVQKAYKKRTYNVRMRTFEPIEDTCRQCRGFTVRQGLTGPVVQQMKLFGGVKGHQRSDAEEEEDDKYIITAKRAVKLYVKWIPVQNIQKG